MLRLPQGALASEVLARVAEIDSGLRPALIERLSLDFSVYYATATSTTSTFLAFDTDFETLDA